MKRLLAFVAAASLSLGTFALVGCESTSSMPPANQGSTAGGNGAFGESPARPGSYSGDQYNQYGNQSHAPSTQPVGRYD